MNNRERIVAAAIKWGDLILTVPQPGRHHHIFKAADDRGLIRTGPELQGFLTNRGRFVGRVIGLEIAKRAEQIREKHGNAAELYSEDIW